MQEHITEAAACKDGRNGVNSRLTELVSAFDRLGFLILKMETDGTDFDLKIRYFGGEEE